LFFFSFFSFLFYADSANELRLNIKLNSTRPPPAAALEAMTMSA
jgi:Tfp pilus assembly ATPase PilU